jgi:hypothetical protein
MFSSDVYATSNTKITLLQQTSGLDRFVAPAVGQIDVGPASKAVLLIPRAFAVAEQHEFLHSALDP